VAVDIELSQLKPEQIREQLRNEIGNLEAQLYARKRDLAKWEALDPEKVRARSIDSRWVNNAKEERQTQIGAAMYDIEKAEIAIAVTKDELARWAPIEAPQDDTVIG